MVIVKVRAVIAVRTRLKRVTTARTAMTTVMTDTMIVAMIARTIMKTVGEEGLA
jgi:hypothetical protein